MRTVDYTEAPQQAVTLLIYGNPGVGKSTAAASLAAACESTGKRALFVDTEAGLFSAVRDAGCKASTIYDVTEAGSVGDSIGVSREAMTSPDVGLLVLDTITELAESSLRDAVGTKQSPELREYGRRKADMGKVIRSCRDVAASGTAVVITAQQEATQVEGLSGEYGPSIFASMRVALVAQVDAVGLLAIVQPFEADAMGLEPGTRYLDFRPNPRNVTKCRLSKELFGDRPEAHHVWPLRNPQDFQALLLRIQRQA